MFLYTRYLIAGQEEQEEEEEKEEKDDDEESIRRRQGYVTLITAIPAPSVAGEQPS